MPADVVVGYCGGVSGWEKRSDFRFQRVQSDSEIKSRNHVMNLNFEEIWLLKDEDLERCA